MIKGLKEKIDKVVREINLSPLEIELLGEDIFAEVIFLREAEVKIPKLKEPLAFYGLGIPFLEKALKKEKDFWILKDVSLFDRINLYSPSPKDNFEFNLPGETKKFLKILFEEGAEVEVVDFSVKLTKFFNIESKYFIPKPRIDLFVDGFLIRETTSHLEDEIFISSLISKQGDFYIESFFSLDYSFSVSISIYFENLGKMRITRIGIL